MKKYYKKPLSLVLVAAMVLTFVGTGVVNQEKSVKAAADYGLKNPRTENGVTTWDKIKFGSYNQTAVFEPEPIKWRVLSVNGNDAFLLADQCLDAKPYNDKNEDVTWETCTLRKWLNKDFYNEAFSENEKKAIQQTTVVNEDNEKHGTEGGNDTKDNVFLLSIAEAKNSEYGFTAANERKAKVTDYATFNNGYRSTSGEAPGNGDWWVRSPGKNSSYAVDVFSYGWSNIYGDNVDKADCVVRPALHINLSSALYTDAGKVTSDGTVSGEKDATLNNPTTENGVTTWDCIYFGNYKQTVKYKKEPIEWRVLSVNGDDAFLLADQCLDCKPYNEEYADATWETCSLRKWLNEDFYNEAFSENEKKGIKRATVVNEGIPEYGIKGGNDTQDNVFLLSIAEASEPKYGFAEIFNDEFKTREAKLTDYAKVNGARHRIDEEYICNGDWWLRSPGKNSCTAAGVSSSGLGDYYGCDVDRIGVTVRPALHINLSSILVALSKDTPVTIPTSQTKRLSETEKPGQTKNAAKRKKQKKLKLFSIKAKKNAKKITGKVSVSKATVKIKVGKKAYKKAKVKGKKFTLKVKKLKKRTKITIQVTKKGYRTVKKTVRVK